jgi:predicted nucleic acid-binding protein
MVLVDTSVWVTHLREGSRSLETLLQDAQVMCHPFVLGELACGNIRNRKEILSLLRVLPMAPAVSLDEVLYFIEHNGLMGTGIGLVDVHLLASTAVAGLPIWTSDKRLRAAAVKLGLSYT